MTQATNTTIPTDAAAVYDENAELQQLGITRVPADNFLWNGYRYTNARDAIAAAKRGDAK